jgi:hypothetical protein
LIDVVEESDSEAEVPGEDPLARTESPDIEIEGVVEGKHSVRKINCYNKGCKRFFTSELAYHEHLSTTHFQEKLLEEIENSQPTRLRVKTMGHHVIVCPECNFKGLKHKYCVIFGQTHSRYYSA